MEYDTKAYRCPNCGLVIDTLKRNGLLEGGREVSYVLCPKCKLVNVLEFMPLPKGTVEFKTTL